MKGESPLCKILYMDKVKKRRVGRILLDQLHQGQNSWKYSKITLSFLCNMLNEKTAVEKSIDIKADGIYFNYKFYHCLYQYRLAQSKLDQEVLGFIRARIN